MGLEDPLITSVKRGSRGVGGWLLCYCVFTTFIMPIPCLVVRPSSDLTDKVTLLTLALCTFSVIAGVNLWMVTRKAIQILRVYFVFFGLCQIFIIAFEIASHDFAGGLHLVSQDIEALAFGVLWAVYFHNSERVRNTYGMNL